MFLNLRRDFYQFQTCLFPLIVYWLFPFSQGQRLGLPRFEGIIFSPNNLPVRSTQKMLFWFRKTIRYLIRFQSNSTAVPFLDCCIHWENDFGIRRLPKDCKILPYYDKRKIISLTKYLKTSLFRKIIMKQKLPILNIMSNVIYRWAANWQESGYTYKITKLPPRSNPVI